MSLNNFISQSKPAKKNQVSLNGALRIMRGKWFSGPVDRFDLKLSRILDCSLGKATKIRSFWVDCGFLAFDKRGLLVWRSGGV